jgi:hypothetical protein
MELKELMTAFAGVSMGSDPMDTHGHSEEAAVRDEEDALFRRFGMNGPGFMSV